MDNYLEQHFTKSELLTKGTCKGGLFRIKNGENLTPNGTCYGSDCPNIEEKMISWLNIHKSAKGESWVNLAYIRLNKIPDQTPHSNHRVILDNNDYVLRRENLKQDKKAGR